MAKKKSKSVKTLKSFIEWAEQFNDGEYVFRGVSNVKYLIEASTYRRLKNKDGNPEKLLKINEELLEDARRQGHGRRDGEPLKDLDLLAELQHRGAATCLIDFTKNPLVALWMACREGSRGNANGKVFAVDISSQLTYQPVTFQLSQEKDIDHFFQRDENGRYQLYQWQPKYQNSRMFAQQSIFLFGAEIESAAECIVFKNNKKDIRNFLKKLAGITEEILFPDFDGFASQRAQNEPYIEPDPQYYLQRGLDAYRESKIDESIDYFTQGISLQLQDKDLLVHLYINRAFAYETKGRHDLAIKDYDEIIRVDPDNVGVYNNRGAAKSTLGLFKEAITDYDEMIRLIPDGIAYNNRGIAKSALGRYDEAISDYAEAIRLNPDYANAYYNRGIEKFELGEYDEAISDYAEAIRLNPNNAEAYNNRGAAKAALDQYEEAITNFDEAIRLNPDYAEAYNNRGNANSALGRYGGAIADYNEAIRLKPDDASFYKRRGNAKSKLERHKEAIADYDRVIHLNSNDAHTYQLRGRTKFELRQYDEAIFDCDKAIRLNPDDMTAYLLRGLVKSELGQLSEAQQDFQMALQLAEQTENADLVAEIKKKLNEFKLHSGESQ